MNIANLYIGTRTDVQMYNGEEVEVTYLIAEDNDGRVFMLRDSGILNCDMPKEQIQVVQDSRIAKIETHLNNAGHLNMDKWEETYSAYGSEAYQGNAKDGYFTQREAA